jgi:hypothetical protein
MTGEHLITDVETRKIVEGFLAASPWLGDTEWEQIVIGPQAEYLADWDGNFPSDAQLREGQQWSWRVSFSDPGGTKKSLSHALVLQGLNRVVYGEHEGTNAFRYFRIQQ